MDSLTVQVPLDDSMLSWWKALTLKDQGRILQYMEGKIQEELRLEAIRNARALLNRQRVRLHD
jgi:hypothetical protein